MSRNRRAIDLSKIDFQAAHNLASIMRPNPGSNRLIHIQNGDSMAPEIPPGAIVIVDTSITWWVKDGFYLLDLPGRIGTAFPPSQQVFNIVKPELVKDRSHDNELWMTYPNPNYDGYWTQPEDLNIVGLVIGTIRCHQH